MIHAWELGAAMKKLSLDFNDEQIKAIISEIDYFGNGMINYTEFITAAIQIDEVLNE